MAEENTFLLERERRMAENKARLEAMGLPEMSAKMAAMKPVKAVAATKRVGIIRKQKTNPEAPCRRSGRNVDKVVNYSEQQPLVVYEEREPRRSLKRPRRDRDGTERGNDRFGAWHPGIPDPPLYAREKALDEALAKIEELMKAKTPAFAKEMLASMVSGGGWLQSPPGLLDYLPVDTDITFTTTDTARPSKLFRYTQVRRQESDRNDAWTVGYLQKKEKATGEPKGGQGFSKNWKGFAMDLFLHPGDYVVFEVISSSELKVHTYRAWDYAEEGDKPEGFDDIRFKPAAADAKSNKKQKEGKSGASQQDCDAKDQDEQQGSETAETSPEQQTSQDVPPKASKLSRSNSSSQNGSRKKPKSAPAPTAAAAAKGSKGKDQAAAAAEAVAVAKGHKKGGKAGKAAAAAAPAAAAVTKKRGKAAAAAVTEPKAAGRSKDKKQKPEVFTVDWIMDAKIDEQSGSRMYKVRWLGYDDPAEDTWQLEETFSKHVRTYDWKVPIPDWVPQQ